jgi:molybdate transport system ATP-binding protein
VSAPETGDPVLRAHVEVRRPEFHLDVTIEVGAGEVVALLGPNGAGKTTTLRALAGLLRPDSGSIELDGDDLGSRSTERRPIGMVFQDYLLFPHMSALDNVAFGPRCQGASRTSARDLARDMLARVGLSDHAESRPRALSGGQAQRVALARALAVRPRLLLLDEPLAALDAHTRLEIRARLRRDLADFDGATLVVTHDPLDAMVLADRLVVIERGSVVQHGSPAEVARHPRTEYVARLVGLNLYRGAAGPDGVRLDPDGDGDGVRFAVSESLEGDVFVAFPPSAVALYPDRPDGSPRNVWPARVDGVERYGDLIRVQLDGALPAAADVTAAAAAELDLAPGAEVWASVKATEAHAYPA